MAARIPMLEPAGNDCIEGGPRDDSELTFRGNGVGELPAGHGDAHATLNDDWKVFRHGQS
jgi:hypothetical protein